MRPPGIGILALSLRNIALSTSLYHKVTLCSSMTAWVSGSPRCEFEKPLTDSYIPRTSKSKSHPSVSGYVAQAPIQVAILQKLAQLIKTGSYTASIGVPKSLVLVGHSFGSGISAAAATIDPDIADGLILTGTLLFRTLILSFDDRINTRIRIQLRGIQFRWICRRCTTPYCLITETNQMGQIRYRESDALKLIVSTIYSQSTRATCFPPIFSQMFKRMFCPYSISSHFALMQR